MSPEEIASIAKVLEIDEGAIHATVGAHWFPNRSLGTAIPSDPVVYRLYEVRLAASFFIMFIDIYVSDRV